MQTIKRPSTPPDAANALSFLVSEDAGFITGQILQVVVSAEAERRTCSLPDAPTGGASVLRVLIPSHLKGLRQPTFVTRV
jgi:hypothetical protein